MTGHQPSEPLQTVLRGPVESSGLDLEAVEVSTAGRRRVVRVLVDKDGGIGLDDLAEATRLVDSVLDSSDVLDETPYTLEVTSPGVDRPLTLPRHWRRNVGRLVTVTGHDGLTRKGRVLSADDDSAQLDVGGTPTGIGYDQVAIARVEVEFNRPASTSDAAKPLRRPGEG